MIDREFWERLNASWTLERDESRTENLPTYRNINPKWIQDLESEDDSDIDIDFFL